MWTYRSVIPCQQFQNPKYYKNGNLAWILIRLFIVFFLAYLIWVLIDFDKEVLIYLYSSWVLRNIAYMPYIFYKILKILKHIWPQEF